MSLSSGGGLDAGSITGIVLGIVVFAGLVGECIEVFVTPKHMGKYVGGKTLTFTIVFQALLVLSYIVVAT